MFPKFDHQGPVGQIPKTPDLMVSIMHHSISIIVENYIKDVIILEWGLK